VSKERYVRYFKVILDKGLRAKSGKLRLNLHGTLLEGKSIGLGPKRTSKDTSQFGEPRCKLGSKVRSNSKIQLASNESKIGSQEFGPWTPSKMGLINSSYLLLFAITH
jgi:hypothetical protein